MDPHLTVVREWDKNYVPNEKQAYHEARINGYLFPNNIGTLTKYELEEIASHPPSIDLKMYKYYRDKDLNQLYREFPALVDIIGKDKITYEDLFYYATRDWVPEYDSINLKIDRWNEYNDLSNVGKSLLDLIYIDRRGYANSMPHPLERVIIDYDTHMDNANILRSLANRINIVLPQNEYPQDSFYDMLYNKIINEVPYQNYAY